MITMSTLGSNGRAGNQFYQVAALIGLAKKYKTTAMPPTWEYAQYFEDFIPQLAGMPADCRLIQEPQFNFVAHWPDLTKHENVDLKGYFQSERYWQDAKDEVKKAFTFKPEFTKRVQDQFVNRQGKNPFEKPTLAISIRRGDYVNNPSYANLPITAYYLCAMFERYPDWRDYNIIVFSDDIPYCRVHFGCLPNVYFSENNSDIEDICLMSMCKNFIIANSTFSLWGAFLAEMNFGPVRVVRPNHHFAGRLKEQNDERDLFPTRWEVFDHLDQHGHPKRLNLKDVSFQIPVLWDSKDREENLDLCVKVLRKNFDAEIRVMENLPRTEPTEATKFPKLKECSEVVHEKFFSDVFWRTKMLNRMAVKTEKAIIFNWDADILIAPLQVWLTVDKLRKGAGVVFPYDGKFARIPRKHYTKLRDYEDIGIVGDEQFSGMEPTAAVSVGGCIAWDKMTFLSIGGENCKFISYGAEDCERVERATKLDLNIHRVPGAMYHLNHHIGVNSSTSNPHYEAGRQELAHIRSLDYTQLQKYVETEMLPNLK